MTTTDTHTFPAPRGPCLHCSDLVADLTAQLAAARTGEPGTPLGRWKAMCAWADQQPWFRGHLSRGWETQLIERLAAVTAERDRLRVDAHGVLASWCLIPFEPVGPSWPRDRFETWIDRLAEHAGIDLRGLSADEARCREMLPAALEGE